MPSTVTKQLKKNGQGPLICPICDMDTGFATTKVQIASGVIYLCDECQGYFLFPNQTVNYDDSGWSQDRKRTWLEDVKKGYSFAEGIEKTVYERWGYRIRKVLEIGCGSGFIGKGFEALGCSYTGIDVDSTSVAFAQEQGLEAYCTTAENLDESPISDRQYDLILCAHVFEHLTDPVRTLKMLNTLARKGIIIIIVPNPLGLYARMKVNRFFRKLNQWCKGETREIVYSIDGYWHNIAFSSKTLQYLANKCHLTVIEMKTIGINDKIFGFVQPKQSLVYRIALKIPVILGMGSTLMLVSKTGPVSEGDK